MLRCASVVVNVSTISSLTKCDGVCISCCVSFLVPFTLTLFVNVEFELLFPVRLGKNEKLFKGVASIVSKYNLT